MLIISIRTFIDLDIHEPISWKLMSYADLDALI